MAQAHRENNGLAPAPSEGPGQQSTIGGGLGELGRRLVAANDRYRRLVRAHESQWVRDQRGHESFPEEGLQVPQVQLLRSAGDWLLKAERQVGHVDPAAHGDGGLASNLELAKIHLAFADSLLAVYEAESATYLNRIARGKPNGETSTTTFMAAVDSVAPEAALITLDIALSLVGVPPVVAAPLRAAGLAIRRKLETTLLRRYMETSSKIPGYMEEHVGTAIGEHVGKNDLVVAAEMRGMGLLNGSGSTLAEVKAYLRTHGLALESGDRVGIRSIEKASAWAEKSRVETVGGDQFANQVLAIGRGTGRVVNGSGIAGEQVRRLFAIGGHNTDPQSGEVMYAIIDPMHNVMNGLSKREFELLYRDVEYFIVTKLDDAARAGH